MMKKLYILIAAAALLFATGCANDPITYDGTTRVSFAITTASFQVKDEANQTLKIPLTTTVPFTEATTIKLKVIPGEPGTANGVQFQCPESVVFPADVYSDTLTISGFYDALATGKKYTFTVALDSTVTSIQGSTEVAINLARFCPLVVADFVGTGNAADEGFTQPYSIELIEDGNINDATLIMVNLFLVVPGDPGYPMTITFNEEDGSITIPASDLWKDDVGLGFPVMLHACGNATNKDAPIVGTFNACDRKIEFSYTMIINDTAAGNYNGYNFGETPVVITMD
jgi:hypothetical protein